MPYKDPEQAKLHMRQYSKEYRRTHKKQIKQYYLTHDGKNRKRLIILSDKVRREHRRKFAARWYKTHQKAVKLYRLKNRKRHALQARLWRKRNPELVKQAKLRWRKKYYKRCLKKDRQKSKQIVSTLADTYIRRHLRSYYNIKDPNSELIQICRLLILLRRTKNQYNKGEL